MSAAAEVLAPERIATPVMRAAIAIHDIVAGIRCDGPTSQGSVLFATQAVAQEFKDALAHRYPPEGYGTHVRISAGHGGFYADYYVGSCE